MRNPGPFALRLYRPAKPKLNGGVQRGVVRRRYFGAITNHGMKPMTEEIESQPPAKPAVRKVPGRTILAAIALLGVGGAIGATGARMAGPSIEVAPLSPVAIASLKSDEGLVTVRGKVGEVYGPMFTLADGSGRTLVDGGPRSVGLIAAGSQVTIQGWNRNGVVRASFLVGTDGKVTPLGAPHDRHGPRHGGPDGPADHDGPPPPPPGDHDPAPPAPTGNSAG
jgi:hypothetical protein